MLNGTKKAKILLNILGPQATKVLSLLSQEHIDLLNNTPDEKDTQLLQAVASDVLSNFHKFKEDLVVEPAMKSSSTTPDTSSFSQEPIPSSNQEAPLSDFGSSLSGSSDFSFGFSDDSFSEESSDNKTIEQKDPLRSSEEIASLLSQQKPQIIAFFLHHLHSPLKEQIMEELTEELNLDIQSRAVDKMPMSQKIFDNLYQQICIKPASE